MECREDVRTSVCSAATTRHELVAARLASSRGVMAGHAKVCYLTQIACQPQIFLGIVLGFI